MASAEKAHPNCPVCHQADHVKSTQEAYSTGVTRCAPPDMPVKNVKMMPIITFCSILVGVFVFCVIVFIGGLGSRLPVYLQWTFAGLTIASIVIALVLSFIAFNNVVRGDAEMTVRFPAWDRAMSTWRGLNYCTRDDVVFDPSTNKVWSDEQLTDLRSSTTNERVLRHSPAISH